MIEMETVSNVSAGIMPMQLADVMPVVVVLSVDGLYVIDMKGNNSKVLAEFSKDFDHFVTAFHQAYVPEVPREWVARKFRQLLQYLELREAHLTEGDLVRIEDGKPFGAKGMGDVMRDASRVYGEDITLFLQLIFRLMEGLKREFAKEVRK
ncbi:hypothetical protein [Thermococcus sp.]|uniref:hypothetical protein n=1 Tax=Thermococcus sp. TaxID=35749 RepID=UPI002616E9BA|nr:hypothetical protein [Thermococcus sp.]